MTHMHCYLFITKSNNLPLIVPTQLIATLLLVEQLEVTDFEQESNLVL